MSNPPPPPSPPERAGLPAAAARTPARLLSLASLGLLVLSPPWPPLQAPAAGRFADVHRAAGIVFAHSPPRLDRQVQHVNALWANFVAAGAVGDFNDDGRDDVFLVSSGTAPNALYVNRGGLRFADVAASAGLARLNDDRNVASGALWFDADDDGRVDLLVLRLGHSLLFRNNGDETFTDVTARSGLGSRHANPISAIAFDYDRDGDLDLLVGGFFADDVDLFHLRSTRFLPEHGFTADNGGSKFLYRNNGDGTFTDVAAAAGITDTGFTTALGHGDYDDDGWQDVYVANDFGPDRLYHNQRDGTFADVTADAMELDNRKGMNVDFGDYNNDGRLEIYVTNITEPWLRECNMLWLNWGDGNFVDVSAETSTCDTGWGWGAKFLDVDNDGRLDLYVANGFVSAGPEDYALDVQRWQAPLWRGEPMDFVDARIWPPIGNKTFAGYQPNRLFHNLGDHHFQEVGAAWGVDSREDGRGVAIADFDDDGALEILVTNATAEPLLYHRPPQPGGHWLEVRLVGPRGNRGAVGARVEVVAGDLAQIREVSCGNGYQSQSSLRQHFGLGPRTRVDRVTVSWPSGSRRQTVVGPFAADQILTIEEGGG